MDNKLLTLTFIISLLLMTSVSALSNDGGGSWSSYKDLNLGYHAETYTPDANTKLYYPFSDSATIGSTYTPVVDGSSVGGDGTVTGALADYGVIGSGMYFDGVNDIIDGPSIAGTGFADGSSITISAWVYVVDAYTEQVIVSNYDSAVLKGIHMGIYQNTFYCGDIASSGNYRQQTVPLYETNKWYHVACTMDASANVYLYVNTVSGITNTGGTITQSKFSSKDWFIGVRANTAAYYFKGKIDEVIITNDVWTPTEIYQYYKNITEYSSYQVTDRVTEIPVTEKTSDLIAYYSFDVDEDDDSWYKYDATNVGTVNASGYIGSARSFDGNDYITAGPNTLIPLGDKTISAWINYPTDVETADMIIANDVYGGAAGSGLVLYYSSSGADTVFYATIGNAAGANQFLTLNYILNIMNANYYHVVLKQESNKLYLYINGVLVASDLVSEGTEVLGTKTTTIGASNDGASYQWNGIIDEVKIFNRALSNEEIKDIYLRTTPLEDYIYGENYKNDLRVTENDLEINYSFQNFVNVSAPTRIRILEDTETSETSNNYPQKEYKVYYNNNLATAANVSTIKPYETATSGLVGRWHLDGNAYGSNFGAAIDGTVTGATVAAEKDCVFGSCYSFDGVSDYITVSDSNNTNPWAAKRLTVSAWFRNTDISGYRYIAVFGNQYWVIRYGVSSGDGNLAFFVTGSGTDYVNAGTGYNDGKWHQVVGTYDGTYQRIYVDGVLKGTDVATMAYISGANNFISFNSATQAFNGNIDEIRIYDYALTAEQIRNDYHKGTERFFTISEQSAVLNATIRAYDVVTSTFVNSFSANVSGTVYYTSNGTITLPFESSNTSLWNITVFNMIDLVDVTYTDYKFSASGNLIAETYPNEQKIKAVKFFHDDPIEISSTTFKQIYYGEFETDNKYKGYISTNLNVYSLVGGNYTCRNSINGTSYNTENEFYLRADSLNTIKILSDVFTLSSGRYSYNLECKVDANEFLVSEIYGKVLFNNLLDFYTTQSFTYTTTSNVLSTKQRSIYLDSVIKTSSNTEFALNVSGNNYTYVFNETNLNQGYNLLLQDLPEDTTYNFTYYSSSPLTVKSVVKEMIVEPDETNISRVNSVMIDQLYYKNITSVDVTVTNNTLLVSAFLNLNSMIADDVGIKLKIGTQEYYYFKSLEAGKNQPIAIEQIFNVSNGNQQVLLQAFASEGVTEVINATLNSIDVDVFDSYTESLVAYARDIYKNTSLTNFSIWYDGTKFTSIDGDLEIFTNNDVISFTLGSLQNGGYFNKTYANFNISNYINASLHQTNVTFIFRHLASNQTITQNITAKDLKYSYTTLTTSSEDRFLFPVDVNYMIFNASNYVTRNQSLNLTPLQTGNIIVYLQPIVNFSIYDERTGLPFNLSIPNEIKVQIVCANTPEVLEYVIDNISDEVNLTCVYDKIKFLVEYDDSSYYRTYPNIAEVFSIDNFNFRAWLLELNTTTAIYNSFNIYDLFGDYINPKILLYKKIGTAEWLITGDSTDVEGKISAFLIQNTEYTIKVLSDNQPERVMGTYFADLAGESTIGLFDISLAADSTSFSKDVYHYIYLVNESGSLKVRAALNDSGSNVDSVRFVVRENDDSGAMLCDQTSITNDVEFSCNVNGTGSSLFYAQLDVTKTTGEVVTGIISKIMKGSELIPFPYEFSTPNAQRYFFFFLILTVGFTATALTSYVSFLILAGLTLFLRVIGWFNISNFSGASADINLAIGGAVISIGLALAIGLLFRKGGQ